IAGRPPEPETPDADGPPERDWHVVLQPYFRNFGILRCPSDPSRAPVDPQNPDLVVRKEYVSSYSVNGWAEYELKGVALTPTRHWILLGERNNIARGPRTWWMFYWWTWQGAPVVWPPAAAPDPAPKAAEDLSLQRHPEQANWLYGDGHVKPAGLSQLWK